MLRIIFAIISNFKNEAIWHKLVILNRYISKIGDNNESQLIVMRSIYMLISTCQLIYIL